LPGSSIEPGILRPSLTVRLSQKEHIMTMRSFVQAKGLVLLIIALVLLAVGGCNDPGNDPVVWTVKRPPSGGAR
jgi:hypothetical protein